MKTVKSSNKSVAVVLHCKLRLELGDTAESIAADRTTEAKFVETPVIELDSRAPSFANFAETWFAENQVRWKYSYKLTLRASLEKHVLPNFGDQYIDEISRSDILAFRASLARLPGRNGAATLSPARVNTVMVPLRLILNEAADRFGFESPYTMIAALRIPRSSVNPFTLDEVNLMECPPDTGPMIC